MEQILKCMRSTFNSPLKRTLWTSPKINVLGKCIIRPLVLAYCLAPRRYAMKDETPELNKHKHLHTATTFYSAKGRHLSKVICLIMTANYSNQSIGRAEYLK